MEFSSTRRLPRETFSQWANRLRTRLEKLTDQYQEYPRSHALVAKFRQEIAQLEQQFHDLRFVEVQKAYKGWLKAYKMEIPATLVTGDWLLLHREIMPEIKRVLHLIMQEMGQFKFQLAQLSEFEKPGREWRQHFHPSMGAVLNEGELKHAANLQLIDINRRIDEFLHNGSQWRHKRVIKMYINVAKYQPLRGSSYVPLPKSESKLYSVLTESANKKKAKGVNKPVVRKQLTHQDYLNCINRTEGQVVLEKEMKQIRSKNHKVYMLNLTKTTLSPLDTKRWICEDGISTLPFGHYSTIKSEPIGDSLVPL